MTSPAYLAEQARRAADAAEAQRQADREQAARKAEELTKRGGPDSTG